MKNITFLVVGITGDLAKRKILPAISQFADLHQTDSVHLIGYSRSKPDEEEITKALHQSNKSGNHILSSITFVQGQYDDTAVFEKLLQTSTPNDHIFVYLATPPHVFIPFLQNTCPLDPSNIDIIIEKPFGQNLEDAEKIIAVSKNCSLTNRIHFFDHYSFKEGMLISSEISKSIQNFAKHPISCISIKALEKLGVDNRLGYYDEIGATKDMLQHLITLQNTCANLLQILPITHKTLQIRGIILGQYEQYPLESSNTETYCKIETLQNQTEIMLETGKNLGTKLTQIRIENTNNEVILWTIDPNPQIEYISKDKNEIWKESDTKGLLEHTTLFNNLMSNNLDRVVSYDNAIEGWKIYQQISQYIATKKPQLHTYKTGFYPIKTLT
jgi:glucose-6-phosphate 1-dehydrogenase